MRFTLALTALCFTALSVVAAPVQLQARESCNVPGPDSSMRDIIYKTVTKYCQGKGYSAQKTHEFNVIVMVTAITESNVNNLDCGDKDSVGLFQQRPSQNWGTVAQIRTPTYAIGRFLAALEGVWKNLNQDSLPNLGVIAQSVQLAEAGNQYTKNLPTAEQYVAAAAKSVGDLGGSDPAPAPAPTSTKTSDPEPTATGGAGGAGGAINVGTDPKNNNDNNGGEDNGDDSGDDDDCDADLPACTQYYTPKSGDNCYKVADMHGINLSQLFDLNPDLDAACQHLNVGQKYCVATA